jgi:plasmid stabilization system protein ParE
MRVEWTDLALDDMEGIRDYIARGSAYYAHRFIGRIFEAAEKLPRSWKIIPRWDGECRRPIPTASVN